MMMMICFVNLAQLRFLRCPFNLIAGNVNPFERPSWWRWIRLNAASVKNQMASTKRRQTPKELGYGLGSPLRHFMTTAAAAILLSTRMSTFNAEDAEDRKWFRQIWSSAKRRIIWRLRTQEKDGHSSSSNGKEDREANFADWILKIRSREMWALLGVMILTRVISAVWIWNHLIVIQEQNGIEMNIRISSSVAMKTCRYIGDDFNRRIIGPLFPSKILMSDSFLRELK